MPPARAAKKSNKKTKSSGKSNVKTKAKGKGKVKVKVKVNRKSIGIDLRSEERSEVSISCDLHIFDGPDIIVTKVPAITCDLSFRGISIVSEVPCPLRVGQTIEAVITLSNDTPEYLAGTVAHCHEIGNGKYELGIQVQAAGRAPILLHDPQQARQLYDWFAESLEPELQPSV